MSKGLKFCCALGIACVILGGGIAGAAIALGADRAVGIPLWGLSGSWDRNWENGSWNTTTTESAGKFTVSDDGDVYTKINKLDIDFSAGNIVMRNGGEGKLQIWTDNEEYYRWYVEDNTLKVDTSKKRIGHSNKTYTLYIQVPQGWSFEDVDIDMAAGNFYADELYASNLNIDMAAGNVEIKSGTIGDFAVDIAAGRVLCRAAVQRELDINMAAGNVNVWMQGKESDYNYDITCALGNISIGNSSYSGMRQKKQIDNHSDYDIDIDCSAGNVTVSFQD